MCGIIGYVGHRRSQDILFAGLKRLEYRGYDSAGVAWREDGRTECVRAVGNLDSLDAALAARASGTAVVTATTVAAPSIGIGHTRWATHGAVTESNAHPHEDVSGRFRIVLNGIIENYRSLRERLAADLIECSSDTDAEVVAQLIALNYDGDLADAVRRSLGDLQGHYAFVAMCDDEPDTLVGVRHECPLVVGIGEGEHFIASSISAFLAHTREVVVLQDDEIVVLRPDEITVFDVAGLPHRPAQSIEVDWDEERCEKDGFETFMLKEIHEQAGAVAETLSHWRATRAARLGRSPVRRAPAGRQPDHHRRVRNLLPRRTGRAHGDRAVGADPGRRRGRLGVPLPRSDHRRRARSCWRSRSRARRPTRWRRCGWPGRRGPAVLARDQRRRQPGDA